MRSTDTSKASLERQIVASLTGLQLSSIGFNPAARIVGAIHPDNPHAPDTVKRNLRVGASPRGVQALIWAGKVEALLDNRKAVAIDDLRRVASPALRHRLILNFEAQAEGVSPDSILDEVLGEVEVR